MLKDSRIYLAGHEGMVGSTLLNTLIEQGYKNVIIKSFNELDLRNQKEVNEFIKKEKPEYIFLIAGKVGGINANIQFPGEYLYDNLMIAANVIESSRLNNVKKLLFLGSSCIYPREAKQPMKEEYLLTGSLEPTNEGYAIGKIAGLKMCEYYNTQYGCNFISAIPPNLFGPKDNFSNDNSHVISALIKKIHKAKINNIDSVTIWGTGSARREFLYTEDLADALIFLIKNLGITGYLNIGSGTDISIKELAILIKKIIGYEGELKWDTSMPDGMPRKLMDSSKIHKLGWKNTTSLAEGLKKTYKWFVTNSGEGL
ncbi:MAG: GDP-L-fucose synthase [Candidatus Marinimicrobia bacterium]|nr:GDP-L-fucose synthase [Candidatus Neomarinimicrobiota bacterium]